MTIAGSTKTSAWCQAGQPPAQSSSDGRPVAECKELRLQGQACAEGKDEESQKEIDKGLHCGGHHREGEGRRRRVPVPQGLCAAPPRRQGPPPALT